MNVYAERTSWFVPLVVDESEVDQLTDTVVCYEDAVTFLFANYPYVISAIAFNTGKPFRKYFWTNYPFTIVAAVTWLLNSLMLLLPSAANIDILELDERLPQEFRWELWGFAWFLLLICWGFEHFVIEGPVADWALVQWKKFRHKGERRDDKDFDLVLYS